MELDEAPRPRRARAQFVQALHLGMVEHDGGDPRALVVGQLAVHQLVEAGPEHAPGVPGKIKRNRDTEQRVGIRPMQPDSEHDGQRRAQIAGEIA